MTNCKLCTKERPLSRSHIIPEFLYEYSANGRALQVRKKPRTETKLVQVGLRERLLCSECEALINERYEKPFQKFWIESQPLPLPDIVTPSGWVRLLGLDYVRFKLFHLAVLWRAHVAQGPGFGQTDLGPHAEFIRRMILDEDPRTESEYQLFGVAMVAPEDGSVFKGLIMPPLPGDLDGRQVYTTVYGGCAWQVVVSNGPFSHPYRNVLREDGSMYLAMGDPTEMPPLRNFYFSYFKEAQQRGWKNPFTGEPF